MARQNYIGGQWWVARWRPKGPVPRPNSEQT
jgi:hypothetical protein